MVVAEGTKEETVVEGTKGSACLLSRFDHVGLFATLWTIACLPMGFSNQGYWSGLPHPPPEDLPNPGIAPAKPTSPALSGMFFTTEPPGKLIPHRMLTCDRQLISTSFLAFTGRQKLLKVKVYN